MSILKICGNFKISGQQVGATQDKQDLLGKFGELRCYAAKSNLLQIFWVMVDPDPACFQDLPKETNLKRQT